MWVGGDDAGGSEEEPRIKRSVGSEDTTCLTFEGSCADLEGGKCDNGVFRNMTVKKSAD